jgi:conjugative transfer region protein TrbK
MSENMNSIARGIAYLVLAAVLVAAAIAFNVGKYPTGDLSDPEPSVRGTDFDAELARCKKIGPETVDAACLVVWEANRHRFFRPGKSSQDRVTDTPAATPDSKDRAEPGYGVPSEILPRLPKDNSPRSPVDVDGMGRRK